MGNFLHASLFLLHCYVYISYFIFNFMPRLNMVLIDIDEFQSLLESKRREEGSEVDPKVARSRKHVFHLSWTQNLFRFVAYMPLFAQSFIHFCIPLPFIHSFIYAFICFHFHSFLLSFIFSFILHPSQDLFIHSFIHSYIFIHSFIYIFIHSFVYIFIHSFIYAFTLSFILSILHFFISKESIYLVETEIPTTSSAEAYQYSTLQHGMFTLLLQHRK